MMQVISITSQRRIAIVSLPAMNLASCYWVSQGIKFHFLEAPPLVIPGMMLTKNPLGEIFMIRPMRKFIQYSSVQGDLMKCHQNSVQFDALPT